MERKAEYFDKEENGDVTCRLCPSECQISPNQSGLCGCRSNREGELIAENYGELVTLAVDPIEKKPLYHFHPAQDILSTGANGCNFSCQHCQNWAISQEKTRTVKVSPDKLLETVLEHKSFAVAFTYTEPMIWYEYISDAAPLLKEAGIKIVLVSNGYINPQPLKKLIPLIDAVNIDLKGIRKEFYRHICKGELQPVLDNITQIHQAGVHLELTNLIIPTQNDSEKDITDLVTFVSSLSDDIPLHFSAYHPDYKANAPATPLKTMEKAKEIAQKTLNYVYIGNMYVENGSDTFCPKCRHLLINRSGYSTAIVGLDRSNCSNCGFEINIIQ